MSQTHDAAPEVTGIAGHNIDDQTRPTSDELACFCGGGFGENCVLGHYAPSIDSSASLPLPNHPDYPTTDTNRKCYSDDGDMTEDLPQRDINHLRMAPSVSFTTTVRLWKRQLRDWKSEGPARSTTHAKRRCKSRVQHCINKVNSVFPRGTTGSGADRTERKELE